MPKVNTLEHLCVLQQQFVAERKWQELHRPSKIAESILIEAAELMERFQWLDDSNIDRMLSTDVNYKESVADEMADVQLYLCSLANRTGINLKDAAFRKLAKNRRKYPIPSEPA